MARPTEYPMAIAGYSKMESGRAYVTARFTLDLAALILPHWDTVSGCKLTHLVEDYGKCASAIDLTSVFLFADRDAFARNTHLEYLTNSGRLRKEFVGILAYNVGCLVWQREVNSLESVIGSGNLQRLMVAASVAICKSTLKLLPSEVISVLIPPLRAGAMPTVQRVQQTKVSITLPHFDPFGEMPC